MMYCRSASSGYPPRSDEVPVSSRTLHGGLACVEVLLRVYAKCADDGDKIANMRIDAVLGDSS